MRWSPWLLSFVSLSFAAYTYHFSQSAEASSSSSPVLEQELRQLQDQYVQLKFKVELLENQLNQKPNYNPQANTTIKPTPDELTISTKEKPAKTTEPSSEDAVDHSMEIHREEVLDKYTQEPRDEKWAASTEENIVQNIEQISEGILPGLKLTDWECRTTVCAIELETTDKQQREIAVRILAVPGLNQAEYELIDTPGQAPRIRGLLSRTQEK